MLENELTEFLAIHDPHVPSGLAAAVLGFLESHPDDTVASLRARLAHLAREHESARVVRDAMAASLDGSMTRERGLWVELHAALATIESVRGELHSARETIAQLHRERDEWRNEYVPLT